MECKYNQAEIKDVAPTRFNINIMECKCGKERPRGLL